jgi:hypothetical protein
MLFDFTNQPSPISRKRDGWAPRFLGLVVFVKASQEQVAFTKTTRESIGISLFEMCHQI